MLRIFSSINGQVEQIEKPENGSWLCLSEPTDVELATVASQTGIDLADLRAPLDDEERSRVDVEDDYTMIIVDIPTLEERGGRDWYETIPLSIIVTENLIITVCMQYHAKGRGESCHQSGAKSAPHRTASAEHATAGER